jgi:GTP-binding protein
MKFQKFVDSVVLHAKAGNGGDGACSFRREKFIAQGGPDGGDGGRGGHVILQANPHETSLIGVYYSPHRKAEPGGGGKGQQMTGKCGEDLIVKVPMGTEIRNRETDELVAEIMTADDQFVAARGGDGGRGNIHWKSSTNQAPTDQTNGELGEEFAFHLVLKIVADIGLVGYPNAGKSSLLTKISKAHPKIGAYPFTTLNPIIGTMTFEDYSSLRVADIPGLIDGAHLGVGLGHEFLRHIERSSFLVIIIDMAGTDNRIPHDDYHALIKELELYKKEILDRPRLIVANKMDAPEAQENLKEFIKNTSLKPIPISAESGEGLDVLKKLIEEMCKK